MRKKFSTILLGILCLMLLSIGCSSTKEEEKKEEEPQYADDSFVQDMSKGLQARWDLNAIDEQKEGYDEILVNSKEYQDMMISYIDAELNEIEKYAEEKFENKNLQEIAIKYINLLEKHKEICDYITVDYDKYYGEFEPIYNERSKVIESMVKDYGMTVYEEHQSILDDFLTNSQLVKDQESKQNAINSMLQNIQFQEVTDDGFGWRTYQAVVENTTGIDFKTLQININLLDADGVIVETTYDQVSSFNNGAKVQFEFSTDKEFVTTQVTSDWWE